MANLIKEVKMKNIFVYNNHLEAKKVLSTLESELEMCDEFIFSVAFISESGLTSLLQTLKNLEEKISVERF